MKSVEVRLTRCLADGLRLKVYLKTNTRAGALTAARQLLLMEDLQYTMDALASADGLVYCRRCGQPVSREETAYDLDEPVCGVCHVKTPEDIESRDTRGTAEFTLRETEQDENEDWQYEHEDESDYPEDEDEDESDYPEDEDEDEEGCEPGCWVCDMDEE
jgi:hypothetical protein